MVKPREGKTAHPGGVVFDLESRSAKWGQLRGASVTAIFHDEIVYEALPAHERDIDYSQGLDETEKRWAAALRKVYKVGAEFFERQPKPARDKLRKQIVELAEKGRGQAGRKAAEVLGVVAEYALEGKAPAGEQPTVVDFKTTGTVTGRTANAQLEAYRQMYSHIADVWRKP